MSIWASTNTIYFSIMQMHIDNRLGNCYTLLLLYLIFYFSFNTWVNIGRKKSHLDYAIRIVNYIKIELGLGILPDFNSKLDLFPYCD